MTYDTIKQKLTWYIEHADKSKVMAMYTLLNEEIETSLIYDEATLSRLEQTRDNIIAGKEKTYSLEQTMANIENRRKKHEI